MAFQLKFSVPEFPVFVPRLVDTDYRRYDDHMKRFEHYAAYVVKIQADVALKAVEKGLMKDEISQVAELLDGAKAAVSHCTERASVVVETELDQMQKRLAIEVEKISSKLSEQRTVQVVTVAAAGAQERGPNYARNERNRQARKAAKGNPTPVERVEIPSGDLPVQAVVVDNHPNAFWKNCDRETFRKLVDSKAKMHVAQNLRKAKEEEDKLAFLESSQAAVQNAVKLAELADKYSSKAEESTVHGFAKTVTEGSADSIVRSLPDSVTSYDSFERKKHEREMAELRAKNCELLLERERVKGEKAGLKAEASKAAPKRFAGDLPERLVRGESESSQDFFHRTQRHKVARKKAEDEFLANGGVLHD